MKFTNRLRKNPEQKEERKIVFKGVISDNASVSITEMKAESYNFVEVIARINKTEYIFEAFDFIGDKGTGLAIHFIGTWNGVEQ